MIINLQIYIDELELPSRNLIGWYRMTLRSAQIIREVKPFLFVAHERRETILNPLNEKQIFETYVDWKLP